MAGCSLRHYIDLIEAAQALWPVSKGNLFASSYQAMETRVPDLQQRLIRFLDFKTANPFQSAGRNDRGGFKDILPGYLHYHLDADAILIYRLVNRSIYLVMICQHADLEGKRMRQTAKRVLAAA